jgi:hypothetical protein
MRLVLFFTLLLSTELVLAQTLKEDKEFLCNYLRHRVYPNVAFAVFREQYDISYQVKPYTCMHPQCTLTAYQIMATYQNIVFDEQGRALRSSVVSYLFVDINGDCTIDAVNDNEEFRQPGTRERVYTAAVKNITEYLKEGRILEE